MKIIVHMPSAKRSDAERVAAAVHALTGARVEIVPSKAAPKTATATLQARLEQSSRFVLANVLGVHVASVNVMEASLAMTLLECPGAFSSLLALKGALEVWPCWEGHTRRARTVYASLRAKLARAGYQLLSEAKGGYGFVRRPDLAVFERS